MASILELKKQSDKTEEIKKDEIYKIDIWIRNIRGKKYVTEIDGLKKNKEEFKDIIKKLKKKFSTGGCIKKKDDKEIISLSGSIGKEIKKYLIDNNYSNEDNIKIHGQ